MDPEAAEDHVAVLFIKRDRVLDRGLDGDALIGELDPIEQEIVDTVARSHTGLMRQINFLSEVVAVSDSWGDLRDLRLVASITGGIQRQRGTSQQSGYYRATDT